MDIVAEEERVNETGKRTAKRMQTRQDDLK